jgi:hypothetical protein
MTGFTVVKLKSLWSLIGQFSLLTIFNIARNEV